MKKFEYRFFDSNKGSDGSQEAVEKFLCDLGSEGWEVIQVNISNFISRTQILGVAKREMTE